MQIHEMLEWYRPLPEKRYWPETSHIFHITWLLPEVQTLRGVWRGKALASLPSVHRYAIGCQLDVEDKPNQLGIVRSRLMDSFNCWLVTSSKTIYFYRSRSLMYSWNGWLWQLWPFQPRVTISILDSYCKFISFYLSVSIIFFYYKVSCKNEGTLMNSACQPIDLLHVKRNRRNSEEYGGIRPVTRKKEQRRGTALTWVSISIDMRNRELFLVSVKNSKLFLVSVSVPHLYRYTNQCLILYLFLVSCICALFLLACNGPK